MSNHNQSVSWVVRAGSYEVFNNGLRSTTGRNPGLDVIPYRIEYRYPTRIKANDEDASLDRVVGIDDVRNLDA